MGSGVRRLLVSLASLLPLSSALSLRGVSYGICPRPVQQTVLPALLPTIVHRQLPQPTMIVASDSPSKARPTSPHESPLWLIYLTLGFACGARV